MKRWFSNETGQAAVEAALLIPVLLFLLMGIFVVGYWLNDQLVVTAAVREGARRGALTGDCRTIAVAVKDTMRVIDTDESRWTLEATKPLPVVGGDLVVKVTYRIPFGFDFFKNQYAEITKDPVFPFQEVVGQATARMEVPALSPAPLECQ
ncbi:MAG: pilus assembly protein [Candidatus Magasanikbacteria bacterium]|nr:pilus assembly protein [Candidatus Magasanikbacteria bacterium]